MADLLSSLKIKPLKKSKPSTKNVKTKNKNPKAFNVANVVRTKRTQQRNLDRAQMKEVVPLEDRAEDAPPPPIIAVMGPKGVGKTTLIRSLVKMYTGQNIADIKGPVTVAAGKKRRVTFFECPLDIYSMTDLSKVADLVLLMIDASYGFEMETFEFLNQLQLHGFPKVMGVMTHLDLFKANKTLQNAKRTIKHRFWTEIYKGAKMFEFMGVINGKYYKHEVKRLSLYISRVKFRPLIWRNTHPYVLVDRIQDVTVSIANPMTVSTERDVTLYGYVRGTHLKPLMKVHLIGVGDFEMTSITSLPDPCPLPMLDRPVKGGPDNSSRPQRQSLKKSKDSLLYAPMSNIGRVQVESSGEMYIDIKNIHYTKSEYLDVTDQEKISKLSGMTASHSRHDVETIDQRAPVELLREMQDIKHGVDQQLRSKKKSIGNSMSLFAKGANELDGTDEDEEGEDGEDGGEEDEMEGDGDEEGSDGSVGYDDDEVEDDEGDMDDQEFGEGPDVVERDDSEDMDIGDGPPSKINGSFHEKDELTEKRYSFSKLLSRPDQARSDLMSTVYGEDWIKNRSVSESVHQKSQPVGRHEEDDELFAELSKDNKGKSGEKGQRMDWKDLDVSVRRNFIDSNRIQWMDQPTGRRMDQPTGRRMDATIVQLIHQLSEERGVGEGKGDVVDENEVESDRSEENELAGDNDDEGDQGDEDMDGEEGAVPTTMEEQLSRLPVHQRVKLLVLKSRFVTGGELSWGATSLSRLGEAGEEGEEGGDEEEEEYGDVEDLQTGEMIHQNSKKSSKKSNDLDEDDDQEARNIAIDNQLRSLNASKKALFKSGFDEAFDQKLLDTDDPPNGKKKSKKIDANEDEDDKNEDEMRKQREIQNVERKERNKIEFGGEGEMVRQALEGYRQGIYVRILIKGVVPEFISNFKAYLPVILGGLLPHESTSTWTAKGGLEEGNANMGFLRARVKRHRWHKRILKSNDPVIFSIGWRRFQSIPIYSIADQNERLRYLKYTPEHMHCMATFYAPLVPPNTGILGFQKYNNNTSDFRIALTGVVIEQQATPKIMKKLKLVGTPHKIFKNTAFITGMFNSALEVAKFESAKLKTVSGIRGTIKSALKDNSNTSTSTIIKNGKGRMNQGLDDEMEDLDEDELLASNSKKVSKKNTKENGYPNGTFRATFEDKILMSDIVICRLWVPVELKQFYNPVQTLLITNEETKRSKIESSGDTVNRIQEGEEGMLDQQHDPYNQDEDLIDDDEEEKVEDERSLHPNGLNKLPLMRTTAEIRREEKIAQVINKDSVYKPIQRKTRVFRPLTIPTKLQQNLPFASKPKNQKPLNKESYRVRRAVVLEPEERKSRAAIDRLSVIRKEKIQKRIASQTMRSSMKLKEKEREASRFESHAREEKKRKYRDLGKEEKRKDNANEGERSFKKKHKKSR